MPSKRRPKLRPRRKTEVLYFDDDAPTTPMQLPPGGVTSWDGEDFEQRDTIPGLTWAELHKSVN